MGKEKNVRMKKIQHFNFLAFQNLTILSNYYYSIIFNFTISC